MPSTPWRPNVRLDERGLRRLLGALEADLMEILWARGESSATEAHAALGGRVALNTVVTVLTRLVAKGLALRSGARRNYRFRPALGRDEFVAGIARELVEGMILDFGTVAAVPFAEVARGVLPADAGRADEGSNRARR